MAHKLPIARVRKRKQWRWRLDLRSVGQGRKFFETEDEAKNERDSIAIEVANHGTSALDLTHEDRLQFTAAKTKLSALGATLGDCLDFYAQHHKATSRKPIPAIVDEMITTKRTSGKRARYVQVLASSMRRLQSGVKGEYPADIAATDIEAWMTRAEFATATRRTLMIDISTFFQFCIKRGYAVSNPVKAMEPIALDDKVPGILTVKECKTLLKTARKIDRSMVDFFAVQLFGGLRPSEAQRKATSINGKFINVLAKGRNFRLVEINPTLRAWMSKSPELPPKNWKRRYYAVRKAAGIPWPSDCLRHTAASMMVPKFGAAKTSNELGHSERVLFRHYRARVTPVEVNKFWALRP